MSPGSTTTVESSSRSSPGNAVMPTAAASPVPRCSACSTNDDVGPRRRLLLDLLGDLLGAVADDDDRALDGRSSLEGVDDVQHHRPAADQVQRLGPVASASACPRRRRGRSRRRSSARSTASADVGSGMRRHRSGERNRTPIHGTKIRCPTIERPRNGRQLTVRCDGRHRIARSAIAGSVPDLMGSLIKKRRKRMRKKKHKKMLRRTRHQRRK